MTEAEITAMAAALAPFAAVAKAFDDMVEGARLDMCGETIRAQTLDADGNAAWRVVIEERDWRKICVCYNRLLQKERG